MLLEKAEMGLLIRTGSVVGNQMAVVRVMPIFVRLAVA
jgi:hypothetical protein